MRCRPITNSGGLKFEKCTCGCPNVNDIVIPHELMRRAAREGLTTAQVAQLLGNPKRGLDAVRAATASMVGQKLLARNEVSKIT